jgi:hypothetical protein
MGLKSHDEQDARVQEIYARWLDAGTKAGFALSLAGMLVYLSGIVAPFIPVAELTARWRLPVGRFLALTGAPTGWGWIHLLGYGDYLNFAGIALFASMTIICYLRVLPILIAHRDRLYALIAAAQILVLLAAASGLLNSFGGG